MADPLSIAAIGWGVSAAGWFVSPYITRLLDRAYAHIKSSKSKQKIRFLLTHTVPKLKLVLEAAEGSEHKHLFEELLKDLRSAFYATEEILDEFEYIRRQQSGRKRKLETCADDGPSNQIVGNLSSVTIPGPLINLLKENVTKIEGLIKEAHETIDSANLQSNIGSDQYIHTVTANNISMPTISVPTGEITGREKVLEDITEMLRRTEDTKLLSVIGIIGIPGSGKTTLAQYVCKSERNASYFDLVIWIHVSEYFSVHNIYSEMFEQAWNKCGENNKERPEYSSLDMLREELEKVLKGKLFLLVLDDIWFSKEAITSVDKLQLLLSPLKVGKKGSKILVTSRQDLLSRLGPDVTSTKYQMPDLDDDVFLKLFMHYALNDKPVDKEDNGKLQRIGAQIAKKLKKSPLLARVVGGILFQKPTVDVRDWISVRDQNLLDKYMGALWWSYQHLDEQVRRCFAYCSIFSRRHHLHRDELVNLWVAEGFITTTNGGQEMEDVGRDYFNKLLSTSFLLPGGKEYNDEEYFLIHDLLHDLAVKVAGSDCFKIDDGWSGNIPADVRHLSIHNCNASMFIGHIVKLKKLRTLIIDSADHDINFDKMFRELSNLRVLIFGTSTVPYDLSLPQSIGCLKHLRYLGLRTYGTEVTLPHTLDKLYLLQVLDLGFGNNISFNFGEDMVKLVDLRHVIYTQGVCFPNIGMLTALQTMPSLNLGRGIGYELHQLKHLNKIQDNLEIRELGVVKSKEEALKARLADKERVTDLELSWDGTGRDQCSPDIQADVIEGLCPPEYLKCLKIEFYRGSRYPIWMMGTQKSTMHLHKLRLSCCSQPVSGPDLFFISVSSLVMKNCNWDTLPYNMEDLTSLEIQSSIWLPSNMEYLTSLTSLILCNCNYWNMLLPTLPGSLDYIEIKSCKIRGRENWEKIKHIPQKNIDGSSFDDIEDEEFQDPSARALQRREWAESRR